MSPGVGPEGSDKFHCTGREGFCTVGTEIAVVDEFGFELQLCAHLEATTDAIVSRQLGGSIQHTNRVLDTVLVEPGPAFQQRANLTNESIPTMVLEADIGAGRFRDWRALLGDGMAAEQAIERAHDIGYLEMEYEAGRERVKAIDRYPESWFDRVVAIENKPDLDSPGGLYEQLRFDTTLGLVDAVILATQSYVTRAHRNRFPDEVGIWRFEPETRDLEVIESPTQLAIDQPGLEIIEHQPGQTSVEPIDPAQKRRARRQVAERAYGKGWRTYSLPPCANIEPGDGRALGLPYCSYYEDLVNPSLTCGPSCPGHSSAPPPALDLDAIRETHSPWVRDPPDRRSRQGRLGEQWTG